MDPHLDEGGTDGTEMLDADVVLLQRPSAILQTHTHTSTHGRRGQPKTWQRKHPDPRLQEVLLAHNTHSTIHDDVLRAYRPETRLTV